VPYKEVGSQIIIHTLAAGMKLAKNKIIMHEQLTAELTGPFKTIIWTIFCEDCCELYISFIQSPVPATKILAANSKKNLSRAMFGC
jgi:hypothetical protein